MEELSNLTGLFLLACEVETLAVVEGENLVPLAIYDVYGGVALMGQFALCQFELLSVFSYLHFHL